jgi:hypothetical protein
VKNLRFLWHYSVGEGEGRAITKSPVATSVICGLLSYGSYWYLSAHYAERLDNLTTANAALQATVGQLQNELKGASPQLAAMQARRAAIRDKLLEFYVAAGPLIDTEISAFGTDKKAMDEAVSSLQQHAAQWTNETAMFLEQNLGPAARDRFLDVSNMMIYTYGVGGEYDKLKNNLANRRKNLSILIETAAYDR